MLIPVLLCTPLPSFLLQSQLSLYLLTLSSTTLFSVRFNLSTLRLGFHITLKYLVRPHVVPKTCCIFKKLISILSTHMKSHLPGDSGEYSTHPYFSLAQVSCDPKWVLNTAHGAEVVEEKPYRSVEIRNPLRQSRPLHEQRGIFCPHEIWWRCNRCTFALLEMASIGLTPSFCIHSMHFICI